MRIAHLSDLHLLCLDGAVPWRLFNKRLTGYANLRLRRGAIHRPGLLRAAAAAVRRHAVDHVVVTGDLTNLALEVEFQRVHELLAEELGVPSSALSVVPGNHDVYTRGAYVGRRFERYFAACMTSDLPALAVADGRGFPFVRLRGPLALIGLSSALPRVPFVAAGAIGEAQARALEAVLRHPEVRSRTPVLLQHHPWHGRAGVLRQLLEGLRDRHREARALSDVASGLLLHGHLHRRVQRYLATPAGGLDAYGATSASLAHADAARRSGFNLYVFDAAGGLVAARSFVAAAACDDAALGDGAVAFEETALPRA
ncbi:MAG: metallophosphoesterase [Polyangiaceae bacterium]|nr:metallophosphoesterase [Polyangiaceae bacterium]